MKAAIVTLVLLLGVIQVRAPFRVSVTPPGGGALIHGSNFAYEGSFKLATGPCGGDDCTANFGGEGIMFDPAGDGGSGSIWVTGFANDYRVAEFRVSDIYASISTSHTAVASLPTATKLAGWTDPTGGHTADIGSSSRRIGGVYRSGSTLYYNVYGYFGNAGSDLSLFRTNADLSGLIDGPFLINGAGTTDGTCGGSSSCSASWTSGAIIDIPAAYQSALGGTHGVSGCCYSIVGRTSSGPSFTSFNLADVGVTSPVVGNRLLGYPSTGAFVHETLGGWTGDPDGTQQWIQALTVDISPVWIPNTRSIIYPGTGGDVANGVYGHAVGSTTGTDVVVPVYNLGSEWPNALTGVSTDATGCVVTIPNADLDDGSLGLGTPVLANRANYAARPDQAMWVRLHGQTTPTQDFPVSGSLPKTHKGVAPIDAVANSGTPSASVTVLGSCFTPNLTGETATIGELTTYDPADTQGTSSSPNTNKGPHAYPYSCTVLAYDADDLATVKAGGAARYWDPVPYDSWDCTGNVVYPSSGVDRKFQYGGSTFDTVNNKLLIIQKYADSGNGSIVTVFGYTAPSPAPFNPLPAVGGLIALALAGAITVDTVKGGT